MALDVSVPDCSMSIIFLGDVVLVVEGKWRIYPIASLAIPNLLQVLPIQFYCSMFFVFALQTTSIGRLCNTL